MAKEKAHNIPLDAETKVAERPDDHEAELRLWLRLLTLSTLIESEVRRRLRKEFATTLPRFDLMAQLERAHDGMSLNELSKRMMVTNGNVTGLVERLVSESSSIGGRRRTTAGSQIVRLTARGPPDLSAHGRRPRRLARPSSLADLRERRDGAA